MATNYYDSFVRKLKEIFMMDHAELDFGIYRIMNQKRQDIMHFLEHELLPQVKEVLADAGAGDTTTIKARMKEIETQAASFGASPEGNPEYQQLKTKLEQTADTAALQNEVFSHLVTFFSRYYDNGDFVSKRRYKDNTYAIPYNGEEVKLHWANADQYYIKSSEYFRDYTFVLPESRRKVHFVLKDATTEQNNNKAANNMERRFAIYNAEGESCFEVNGDEMSIFFTYELMPKATKQESLLADALAAITPIIPEAFMELLNVKCPTANNANRTLLEKHLTDYTAKNSFDYFIHKDLGGFLRRELDFYIKNEVMLLDDLDAQHIQGQLTIIKAIKQVGDKIIRMLAQLEDFQKRLWLKKKFVVQSDYCITLDRVPESLYEEICQNDEQRKEWVRLFAIDEIKGDMITEAYSEPLTMEFLHQNPFLVLDTAFFSPQFKHKLVSHLGDKGIDEQCNGLLINSDNYQALQFIQNKYQQAVDYCYIDPPYNTDSTPILYKNGYKDSSWLTLLNDRIQVSTGLLNPQSVYTLAIDDTEFNNLSMLLKDIFPEHRISPITVVHNPKGSPTKDFNRTHEYAIFITEESNKKAIGRILEENETPRKMRRWGENSLRIERPLSFYPIYVRDNKIVKIGKVPDSDYHPHKNELCSDGTIAIYPIDQNGIERRWNFGLDTITDNLDRITVIESEGEFDLFLTHEMTIPKTVWKGGEFDAGSYGNTLLINILGNKLFDFPKSINTMTKCIELSCQNKNNAIILDYFGGSGSTAHAVIKQNIKEKTDRKYLTVEMGNYFDKVTRSRIEKVIYSPDWKDGKPVSRQGISQCFKYIRLEQYEDTLNNLELKTPQQAVANFEDGSHFKESYMLGYMLDTETRDSLLNLKMFENPFAMTLKTTKDNELVPTQVDMVETFNYLIGLNVETEDWYRDDNICVVTGRTHREGYHTLVIWRNCTAINNEELNKFFERMDFRTRDSEFDLIYVNGDNTLPNLKRDEDHWKVVLTEEEFAKRMFEE